MLHPYTHLIQLSISSFVSFVQSGTGPCATMALVNFLINQNQATHGPIFSELHQKTMQFQKKNVSQKWTSQIHNIPYMDLDFKMSIHIFLFTFFFLPQLQLGQVHRSHQEKPNLA